jgi:NAD(P) transhydrogenase subunit alpha
MQRGAPAKCRFPLWGRIGGGGTDGGRSSLRFPGLHAEQQGYPRRGHSLALTAVLVLAPTAALAAGGEDVSPLVYQFMVFVIAIFVGYYVVWSVTPALHTPLMSVTNAISSVIVVGALLAVGVSLVAAGSLLAKLFGFLALVMASVNIFGGFLVTQRMLAMYKKREPKK